MRFSSEKRPGDATGSVQPRRALSEAICRECTANLREGVRLSGVQRYAMSIGVSTVTIALFLSLVPHEVERVGHPLFALLGWVVAQALLLLVSFRVGRTRRASPRVRKALVFLAASIFGGTLWLGARQRVGLGEFLSERTLTFGAARCALGASIVGSVVALGTFFAWRRTDPFTPGLSGLVGGTAGGLIGAATVGVVCRSSEAWHLVLGHGVVVLVLAMAGWVAGRRVLAP